MTRSSQSTSVRSVALAIVPAALQTLLTVLTLPPFGLSLLAFVAFIPIVYILHKGNRLRYAVLNSLVYGTLLGTYIYYGGGIYYSVPSGCIVGVFWGACILVTGLAYRRSQHPLTLFLLPVLWTCCEVGIEYVDFGGYTIGMFVTSVPIFSQLAALGGPYLLCFTLYAINIALYFALSPAVDSQTRRFSTALTLLLLSLMIGYGVHRLRLPLGPGEDLDILIVQSFIDEECYVESGQLCDDLPYKELLRQAQDVVDTVARTRPDLVILPETEYGFKIGIPKELHQIDPIALPEDVETTWLTYKKTIDTSDTSKRRKYVASHTAQNGILHLQPKVRALPFLESHVITSPPSTVQVHEQAPGRPASLICYESVLADINRRYAEQNPGFISIASGAIDTEGAKTPVGRVVEYAQLEISRLRAIESGKYVVRAANAMGSAVIDPRGRLIQVAPIGEFGYLRATIRTQEELTPYMRLVRWAKQ
jgi:apolipoprotein N-acyltransferase